VGAVVLFHFELQPRMFCARGGHMPRVANIPATIRRRILTLDQTIDRAQKERLALVEALKSLGPTIDAPTAVAPHKRRKTP
jgi:hypothetical protein